jgi:hypothetical protein
MLCVAVGLGIDAITLDAPAADPFSRSYGNRKEDNCPQKRRPDYECCQRDGLNGVANRIMAKKGLKKKDENNGGVLRR